MTPNRTAYEVLRSLVSQYVKNHGSQFEFITIYTELGGGREKYRKKHVAGSLWAEAADLVDAVECLHHPAPPPTVERKKRKKAPR